MDSFLILFFSFLFVLGLGGGREEEQGDYSFLIFELRAGGKQHYLGEKEFEGIMEGEECF